MTRLFTPLLLVLLTLVTACQPPAQLNVKDAYVRVSPVEGRPAAGYFRITGGPNPVELVSVSSRSVERLELHETINTDGVAQMRPVVTVAVPAGEDVLFQPGGRHIMIWGIDETALEQGSMEFIATFTSGDRIVFSAEIMEQGITPAAEE